MLCNDTTIFLFYNSFLKKKIYFCGTIYQIMWQRIQTAYLTISIIASAVLPYIFPLWKVAGKDYFFMKDMAIVSLFGLSTALAFISIISFKKRQNQFVLNRLNIILNLILLGLLIYRSQSLSGGVSTPEKGIGMFLPIISIVMLVLANKAIKKDEDLVKSVDRLR